MYRTIFYENLFGFLQNLLGENLRENGFLVCRTSSPVLCISASIYIIRPMYGVRLYVYLTLQLYVLLICKFPLTIRIHSYQSSLHLSKTPSFSWIVLCWPNHWLNSGVKGHQGTRQGNTSRASGRKTGRSTVQMMSVYASESTHLGSSLAWKKKLT